jgi:hypothetical protein
VVYEERKVEALDERAAAVAKREKICAASEKRGSKSAVILGPFLSKNI